jgi:hypothetical protein
MAEFTCAFDVRRAGNVHDVEAACLQQRRGLIDP